MYMHQFFDPSIKPVVTTDLDGNIKYVRTYGLQHYGYPDLYIEESINNYEELFHGILDKIYTLDFDINHAWYFNGSLLSFEMIPQDNLAKIKISHDDEVNIVTMNNPLTQQPYKLMTTGTESVYNHPEIKISASILHSKEILKFAIDEIRKGEYYDDESYILFEDQEYYIERTTDRFGNAYLEIRQLDTTELLPKTIKRGQLKRVK
ncbi:hypothetical protein PUW24_00975 (plasmid) [Paenibacillus urinalis]|uniref:Uncharacterized protein n=1 Tax=Paenibacillus urinalis TaxID=521520 RepID=A0AAX3N6F4_9BACL|nr:MULTISPECIES: hypothetical protein [Paenibacillus]MCM3130512.1 hypothetical protein [Paenibacillus sp. MER 78]WDH85398.1 hypothetical protein PUW23_25515 [Paenibacillus urinalis]WDH95163.1 hypothetical protein PUW24_00975 [Paenibacillus urinalis]WDI05364.1 hypothetical protein PUW25_26595 [Paenibacillus urinalis]